MKSLLLVLMGAILFNGVQARPEFQFPKEVKIIVIPFPPYMTPDGEKGMAITFIRKALAAKGTKAKFIFMPPRRAMRAFLKGEGMLIGSSALFDKGNFTMLRLTMVRAGIYQLPGGAPLKKIAYLRGVKRAQQALKDSGLEPIPVSNYNAGLKMLSTGRLGGFLAVNLPLNFELFHSVENASIKLKLVRRDFYKDAGGLVAAPKDLAFLKALKRHISTEEMRRLYSEVVKEELAPYLGSFRIEDYMWDDFELVELNNSAVELTP